MAMMVLDDEIAKQLIAERQASGADRYDEVWESVYMMAPLANNEHQDLQLGLAGALRNALGWASGARVQAGANVSDREDNWTENYRCPDVVVVLPAGAARDCGTHWCGGPDFCVEILSPGDRSREKLDFYSAIGVRELLLVDRAPWALELYRLTSGRLKPVKKPTKDVFVSQVAPVTFRLLPSTPRQQIEVTHRDGVQRWLV
jgi:Uma2 family endonuclease